MKKSCLVLLLSPLVFTSSYAAPGVVGFVDHFTVTIASSKVAPIITFIPQGSTQGIYAQNYYCTGSSGNNEKCYFATTDNWEKGSGKVEFLIGANSRNSSQPYCDVTITDGSGYPVAEFSATCQNGVTAPTADFYHVDEYHYTFDIKNLSPEESIS